MEKQNIFERIRELAMNEMEKRKNMEEFDLTTNCGKLPFNLSEKIDMGISSSSDGKNWYGWIDERDVKEFIRLLKEELKCDLTGCFTSQEQCDEWNKNTNEIINNLAGEKLKNNGRHKKPTHRN